MGVSPASQHTVYTLQDSTRLCSGQGRTSLVSRQLSSLGRATSFRSSGLVFTRLPQTKPLIAFDKLCRLATDTSTRLRPTRTRGRPLRASKLAKKHGKTPAQILLRWSVQRGYVPLVKSV